MIDWFPIRLSFAVATAATLIALVAGSGLAWLLARTSFRGQAAFDCEMRQVRVYGGSGSRRHERVEL